MKDIGALDKGGSKQGDKGKGKGEGEASNQLKAREEKGLRTHLTRKSHANTRTG